MQRTTALAIALALFTLPAISMAQGTEGAHHDHAAAPMSEGVVKKVDKGAGKITVQHGPLENLGMPPMTMVFRVKEAAWLDALKAGDKIRFVVENQGGAYTVTRYESVK